MFASSSCLPFALFFSFFLILFHCWILYFWCSIIIVGWNFDAEWRDIVGNHVEKMCCLHYTQTQAHASSFRSIGQRVSLCKAFVFRQWKRAKRPKKANKLESETEKESNTNECHDRHWMSSKKSKIFFIQCNGCKFGRKYYALTTFFPFEMTFVFRGQHTLTHQPKKPYTVSPNTAALFTKMCFFLGAGKNCVCVWVRAIVIRRRHHGTKHETKRNKIILWHQLMVLF